MSPESRMKPTYARVTTLIGLLLVAGCTESPAPTEVGPPEFVISDAANGGSAHFYFLPPMVPDPSTTGTFDGGQKPVVEICVWDGSTCGASLELYTTETGPGSETIRVEAGAERYIVNWHTDDILTDVPIDVSAGESYRIRVLVGIKVLGYADVQVVNNGKELKNVDTDAYIPLVDGRTLPIRFRIEEGFENQGEILSAGVSASCAVDEKGDAYCWGANYHAQLGIGPWSFGGFYDTPQLVTGGHKFASVSTGGFHTCGVTIDGNAYCWGSGRYGQLGDGSSGNRSLRHMPVLVSGDYTFASITTGLYHTCGVTTNGDAYCWGYNGHASLGNGTFSNINPVPGPVSGGHSFQSISSEAYTTCGLTTAGTGYCWGNDYYGMVGAGTTFPSHGIQWWTSPTLVTGGHTFVSLDAGHVVTCGVTTAAAAFCWGYNQEGAVGGGFATTTSPYAEPNPVAVAGGHTFSTARAGGRHACGVTDAGAAYCWGWDIFGQLGTGGASGAAPNPSPLAVAGGHTFQSIDLGVFHTCGATTGGEVLCWGRNRRGQIGDGTSTNRFAPVFTLDLDPTTP